MPSPEYLDRLVLRQPSLPKARQWLVWLDYHRDHLPYGDSWERCVTDCMVALHHGVACAARRVRGNPIWDIQGTMTDDTAPLEDGAQHWVRTLERYYPRDPSGHWRGCPEQFQKAMDCLYGGLRQQIRLAREIDQMRRDGQLDIEVAVDMLNQTAVEK